MTEAFRRATMRFLTVCAFALLLSRLATPGLAGPADTTNLLVEITWGHRSAQVQSFYVKLAGRELALVDTRLTQGEATDFLQDGVARTSAGAGDVDRLSCTLLFAPKTVEPITNAHSIWKHLWKHGDAGAAQRLQADPAYPLDGPLAERRGDIQMVLLQKMRLTELAGTARTVPVRVVHERDLPAEQSRVSARTQPASVTLETGAERTLLAVEGAGLAPQVSEVALAGADMAKDTTARVNRIELAVALPANGTRELIVKLPSPVLPPAESAKLLALDYAASRAATLKYWNDYLAQGAMFNVPEEAVNTLFRANLWHALRLPRRHGGAGPDVKIDLPYSNFAYDQTGMPWPVDQSVYVDYMLYDLRGHHAIAAEEYAAMYRHNQEKNGHVGGFANWGVYTPGMLYSVAQHYLLSGDRASFDRLLPETIRAL